MKKSNFLDPFDKARLEKGFGEMDDQNDPVVMVLRHKDVKQYAKDWGTFQSGAKPGRIVVPSEVHIRDTRQIPFEVDPPLHKAYRDLVEDWFRRPFKAAYETQLTHQIEGLVEAHQNVVVVEDLISTGKSSLAAVEALKAADLNVKGMMAIFTYGFELAETNFSNSGVALNTLSDYGTILEQAEKSGYIKSEELELLAEWRKGPDSWDPKMMINKPE